MPRKTSGVSIAAIEKVCIPTWEDLTRLSDKLFSEQENGKTQWVFRGVGSGWSPFVPKLERIFTDFQFADRAKRLDLERALVREFQRKLNHHLTGSPPREVLEVLSLMRHHGGPTRLLDLSYSVFVSAFFALESTRSGTDAEVWALNADWCRNLLPGKYVPRSDKTIGSTVHEDNGITNRLFKSPYKIAYPVNPYSMNARLATQRGLFLFPGDISVSLSKIIETMAERAKCDLSDHLKRYVIPWHVRKDFLLNLHRVGIGKASLFPGLDGFTESLNLSWWILDPYARAADWHLPLMKKR